ncbi:hypothetical protein N866_00750 [Actinotalea ferrariae CF5-4]|uniref:DUF72 domain-containing protein n=1 Tax=Actinotalea ferrariae CF5-4 TaxID=948458 RepID=A0A021VQM5_9CELL|nr:DUF72 domain-containing protein [Actinotalea ferrariae]EYR63423.1 hypothetical protein N866_00750 [Actinotalea ferrariae CF5-4]
MAQVRIGISGWRYAPWRGVFYPPGLAQRRELEHASRLLSTVEINGSFYALQRPESYAGWAATAPEDFVFSVKGGRYITHMLKLTRPESALANFFASGVMALGPKLGPFLWQLPPVLRFDPERLDAFFRALPRTTTAAARLAAQHDARLEGRSWTTTDAERPLRHVLEVRHQSFATAEAVALLREHDVGLVVADTAGKWPLLEDVTSDLVYVRLHGAEELYVSGYDDASLERWAAKIRRWAGAGHDVLVYFDNDVKVHAPFDAQRLAALLHVGPGTDHQPTHSTDGEPPPGPVRHAEA